MSPSNFYRIIVTVFCLLLLCFNSTEVFANSHNDGLTKMYNSVALFSFNPPSSVGSNEKDYQVMPKDTAYSQSKDPYDDPFYLSKKYQKERLEFKTQKEEQERLARNEENKDFIMECLFCGIPALILLLYAIRVKYPLFNLIPKIAVIVLLILYRNHTYYLKGTEFCELLTFIVSLATIYEIGFKKVIALPFYLLALLINPIESFLVFDSQESQFLTFLAIALLFFVITLYLAKIHTTKEVADGTGVIENLKVFRSDKISRKDMPANITNSSVGEMFCANCGGLISQNAKFCPNCGYEIDSTRNVHNSLYNHYKNESVSKDNEFNDDYCINCGRKISKDTIVCPCCGIEIDRMEM